MCIAKLTYLNNTKNTFETQLNLYYLVDLIIQKEVVLYSKSKMIVLVETLRIMKMKRSRSWW
jgi:hypothetical protein